MKEHVACPDCGLVVPLSGQVPDAVQIDPTDCPNDH